jgi:hypothetical protein
MVNCGHCGKELSEPVPNFCPNCGKPTSTVQINLQETPPKRESISDNSVKLLFGKTSLDIDKNKTVGKFVLNGLVNVTYNIVYLYGFNAYKSVVRGSKTIVANEFGYLLLNPTDKSVFGRYYADNTYPKSKDIKDVFHSEYVKVYEDKTPEDNERFLSLIKNYPLPEMIPPESLTKSLVSIAANNLIVEKTYVRKQKSKYDIPLSSVNPESDKILRKKILGYSQRVILDEVNCSMKKRLGRECNKVPEIVCSICGQIACLDHSKKCDKCGKTFCEDCITSKGLFSKKHFCKNCYPVK